MSTYLRSPILEEVLQKHLPKASARELQINPEGGMFDARNLASAIRRAKANDVIVVPPGEYAAFELKKSVRFRCLQPDTVFFKGTMLIRSEFTSFSGMDFLSASEQSAFRVEKGTLVLKDCVVSGEITAGAPGANIQVFLQGCLAGRADEGIVLSHQTLLEVSESRISDCRIGLALRQGAVAALYHSRIESCLSTDESNPGVGIFSEQATLYCEGVSLRKNGVGVYLIDNPESHLLSTLFEESKVSALIVANETASSTLRLHSSVASHQRSPHCAQFFLKGGVVRLAYCRLHSSPSSALSGELVRLEMNDCSFVAQGASALDIDSCHITAETLTMESLGAPALTASGCQGEFRNSRFIGQPPINVTACPQLVLTDNSLSETAPEPALSNVNGPGTTIDTTARFLKKAIVQESIRSELERILRLAHAGQQRQLQGLPVTDSRFHYVFLGPAGTGKLMTAGILAEALFAFDAISSPRVVELPLESLELSSSQDTTGPLEDAGVIFLRIQDTVAPSSGVRQKLTQWLDQSDKVVILEGERDSLRRVLRAMPELERMFRKTLFFTRYGPIELTAHFAKLSEADEIALSPDAAQTLLLILHFYCERKDKRFAHTTGVELLYDNARHRFLERCSLANRMDLLLETCDLDIPPDHLLQTALDRSPAFVTWCPHCQNENPWLVELAPSFICLHCGTSYSADWGTWKEAVVYREIRDAVHSSGTEVVATSRTVLPPRMD